MPVNNPTTNYGWALPVVGASIGAWGTLLNAILGDSVTGIDTRLKDVSNVANAALPLAGGNLTGNLQMGGTTVLTSARAFSNVTADAAIIASGVFPDARIPLLDASKVTTGVFAAARIPSLAASIITSGVFADAQIPALAGSKITSGTVAPARLGSGTPDGTSYLRGDGVWSSPPTGVTGSGTLNSYARWTGSGSIGARTPAEVLSDIGAAASSHSHDASAIVSGTLADARLSSNVLLSSSSLNASNLGSGTVPAARITSVTSGATMNGETMLSYRVSTTAPGSVLPVNTVQFVYV